MAIYHGFVVLAVAELALGFLTALLITAVDFQHSKADLAEKRLEGDIDLKRISSGRNSLCRPV